MHEDQPGTGEFGRLLAAIQKRTGLSHQDIADATGVNRSQVWRWVHSGSAPGYEPVRRLTAYLLAERPEVAEPASRLLLAAGYEMPPAVQPAPPATLLPATEAMEAAMMGHLQEMEVRVEFARRRHPGARLTGSMVFPTDTQSAASWDHLLADDWDEPTIMRGLAAMTARREQLAALRENDAGSESRRRART